MQCLKEGKRPAAPLAQRREHEDVSVLKVGEWVRHLARDRYGPLEPEPARQGPVCLKQMAWTHQAGAEPDSLGPDVGQALQQKVEPLAGVVP